VDSGGAGFLPGPLKNVSSQSLAIGAIVILVGAFLVYAVYSLGAKTDETPGWVKAELNDDPELPGTYIAPHPGPDNKLDTVGGGDDRTHYATGTVIPICTQEAINAGNLTSPLCYASNPPTSGPHADQPMPFGVLNNPAPKENLVHNMEHGGVVIWYNTSNQDVINQLKSLVNDQRDRQRFVVLTQYTGMEPETIAVTSWTRLDKFPAGDYDKKRIEDFISEHHKRFNPEGF
jgi:hypothetical protein